MRTLRALPVLLFLAVPATAADVIVDCSGGTPGAFTSINAAISSLSGAPPAVENWILLRSDCVENVSIVSGNYRLGIAPEWDRYPWACCTTNGPLAGITAANPNLAALNIAGPSDVILVHLSLRGGSTGLSIGNNAVVNAYGVVAEDNTSGVGRGISITSGGQLSMGEGGARNNAGEGLAVVNGSVTLFGRQPWLRNQPLVIRGNAKGGVRVGRASLDAWAGVAIRDNLGPGLQAYGGDLSFGAVCCDSPTIVEGNAGGLILSEGSEATLWGDTVFRGNGAFGIYLEGSSHASLFELLEATEGGIGVRVDGHTEVGVSVTMNSQVSFHGVTKVRGNGSELVPTSGGVRVDGNSQAFFEGSSAGSPLVANNVGPGILADLNSSVDARAVTVRGNSREGVRVRHQSVVDLGPESRIRPNTDGPLTCDGSSLVITDLVPASAACAKVEAPSEPRPTRHP